MLKILFVANIAFAVLFVVVVAINSVGEESEETSAFGKFTATIIHFGMIATFVLDATVIFGLMFV